MAETLRLEKIRTDGGTQPRINLYEETVQEYKDAVIDGANFPPVVVFHDGSDHWLADGFHRFHAHRLAKSDAISAEIHQGTRREAILYSVGANSAHGIRRTNADKRQAVETLLSDDEWSQWSDREIARKCGVNDKTVGNIRRELTAENPQSEPRTYTTRHGTQATMKTENIGKTPSAAPAPQEPKNTASEPDRGPEEHEQQTQPQSRGVGVKMAHEAIAALKRIPLNDGLRQDAFSMVEDWIKTNRGN